MNKKILIVEDDSVMGLVLKEIFKFNEWEVEIVKTGLEALSTIPKYNPDVILSDINMPDMDGVKMLENLYNAESLIPVIFLSGYRDINKMTLAWIYCAYDFLDKPFDKEKLMMVCDAAAVYGKDFVFTARKRSEKMVKKTVK